MTLKELKTEAKKNVNHIIMENHYQIKMYDQAYTNLLHEEEFRLLWNEFCYLNQEIIKLQSKDE